MELTDGETEYPLHGPRLAEAAVLRHSRCHGKRDSLAEADRSVASERVDGDGVRPGTVAVGSADLELVLAAAKRCAARAWAEARCQEHHAPGDEVCPSGPGGARGGSAAVRAGWTCAGGPAGSRATRRSHCRSNGI